MMTGRDASTIYWDSMPREALIEQQQKELEHQRMLRSLQLVAHRSNLHEGIQFRAEQARREVMATRAMRRLEHDRAKEFRVLHSRHLALERDLGHKGEMVQRMEAVRGREALYPPSDVLSRYMGEWRYTGEASSPRGESRGSPLRLHNIEIKEEDLLVGRGSHPREGTDTLSAFRALTLSHPTSRRKQVERPSWHF